MGNWSELCDDILGLIVDRFVAIEDIVHFGAICRPWRLVSIEKRHCSIDDPWLMLAEKEDSDKRGFYSLFTKKVYHLDLPEARGKRCWSSCCWLMTLGLDLEIHLLNPFTRDQIRLPTLPIDYGYYFPDLTPEDLWRVLISKMILSSRPSRSTKTTLCVDDKACVVMVIFDPFKELAFLRLEDEVWTFVDCDCGITDVVYFNGQFYATTFRGEFLIVDISCLSPKTIEFGEPIEYPREVGEPIENPGEVSEPIEHPRKDYDELFYLVESVRELFMLAREIYEVIERDEHNYLKIINHETEGFDVFKFNFDYRKWTQVKKSLDNHALFVGGNASFAIFPSNQLGCEPNVIYFTDDNLHYFSERGVGHVQMDPDMGLFRMDPEETDPHYVGPDIISSICTPLWICPLP